MIRRFLRWLFCSRHIHRPLWAVEVFECDGSCRAFGRCRWCRIRLRLEGRR